MIWFLLPTHVSSVVACRPHHSWETKSLGSWPPTTRWSGVMIRCSITHPLSLFKPHLDYTVILVTLHIDTGGHIITFPLTCIDTSPVGGTIGGLQHTSSVSAPSMKQAG